MTNVYHLSSGGLVVRFLDLAITLTMNESIQPMSGENRVSVDAGFSYIRQYVNIDSSKSISFT